MTPHFQNIYSSQQMKNIHLFPGTGDNVGTETAIDRRRIGGASDGVSGAKSTDDGAMPAGLSGTVSATSATLSGMAPDLICVLKDLSSSNSELSRLRVLEACGVSCDFASDITCR